MKRGRSKSAPKYRLHKRSGTNSGRARVLSRSDRSVLYNFDGDSSGDQFGWSVSGTRDVDGDGIDDFIRAKLVYSNSTGRKAACIACCSPRETPI